VTRSDSVWMFNYFDVCLGSSNEGLRVDLNWFLFRFSHHKDHITNQCDKRSMNVIVVVSILRSLWSNLEVESYFCKSYEMLSPVVTSKFESKELALDDCPVWLVWLDWVTDLSWAGTKQGSTATVSKILVLVKTHSGKIQQMSLFHDASHDDLIIVGFFRCVFYRVLISLRHLITINACK
jgi:hypothetical protein